MQQLLSSLEEERQRQFRRFVAISAGAHVVLALLFWIGPIRTSTKALPVVERVALVPTLPAPPSAKPAQAKPAKPAPAPVPPPPAPPVQKVLPKQPAPLPKPKPPELKAKPQAKPEPKQPEPKQPEPEQELDDVIAQLRNEAGETTPRPVEQVAAAVGPAGGPGIVDPELARWIKEVKIRVTRAWIVAPNFQRQPLETLLEVEVGATGDVQGVRVTQSSGNPWYDENVERALQKASPLPVPPRAAAYEFSFRPDELQ